MELCSPPLVEFSRYMCVRPETQPVGSMRKTLKSRMKKIFSLTISVGLSFVHALSAQESDKVPVGFINAVGLTTKTDFQIDQRPLKPAGFSEGGYAASFGLSPGKHEFSFSNDACEKISLSVEIRKGLSPVYVLYKISVRRVDGTTRNVLKLADVPQQALGSGPQFFIFSTLEGRLADLTVNGANLSLPPLKLSQISGQSLFVEKTGRKSLRSTPRERRNFVLVLFDGADSRMRWSLIEMTD